MKSLKTNSINVNIYKLGGGVKFSSLLSCNDVTCIPNSKSSDFLYSGTEGRLSCFVSIRNNFNIN